MWKREREGIEEGRGWIVEREREGIEEGRGWIVEELPPGQAV